MDRIEMSAVFAMTAMHRELGMNHPQSQRRQPSAAAPRRNTPAAARPKRLRPLAIALPVLSVLAVAGLANAAWSVIDVGTHQRVDKVERAVRDQIDKTEEFRKQSQPQFNGAGGVYDPYQNRQQDYDLPAQFQARQAGFGMQAKCGAQTSYDETTIWQMTDPSAGGANVAAAQAEICQRLVAAENLRFNQVMKMMVRVKARNDALKQMAQSRSNIQYSGELGASDNNLSMFIADSQVEIQYIQAKIAAYDSLIVSLKQNQDVLANQALNGSGANPLVATGVRMAALEAGLAAVNIFD